MTAFVRYIQRCPRREAELLAKRWAVNDATEIAALRSLSVDERKVLETGGGWDAIRNSPDYLNDVTVDESTGRTIIQTPDRTHQRQMKVAEAVEHKVNQTVGVTLGVSWDALFKEWRRIRAPKRTRAHQATVGLLKAFFGERDCRETTQTDIGKFRDSLKGKSYNSVAVHLLHISSMFAAAIKEPSSEFRVMKSNPASGVKPLGKPEKKDGADQILSPIQVRTILETAERVKFGNKRHEEVLWMLRLLAFTGARPNEISQLQRSDVLEQDGIRSIRITQARAGSRERHPHKSVKTGEARDVPLHPEILAFFEYAKKFGKDDFIFRAFPWNKDNGRAAWLTSNFKHFLEKDCGIAEPAKRLKLSSLRHSFITAMRTAGIPVDVQKHIVGHGKDVHANYGTHNLQKLYDAIAKTNPLG